MSFRKAASPLLACSVMVFVPAATSHAIKSSLVRVTRYAACFPSSTKGMWSCSLSNTTVAASLFSLKLKAAKSGSSLPSAPTVACPWMCILAIPLLSRSASPSFETASPNADAGPITSTLRRPWCKSASAKHSSAAALPSLSPRNRHASSSLGTPSGNKHTGFPSAKHAATGTSSSLYPRRLSQYLVSRALCTPAPPVATTPTSLILPSRSYAARASRATVSSMSRPMSVTKRKGMGSLAASVAIAIAITFPASCTVLRISLCTKVSSGTSQFPSFFIPINKWLPLPFGWSTLIGVNKLGHWVAIVRVGSYGWET
mmetsp:Transcript_41110/g.100275  ORF Transcript_41110/g.100275 Transcript_41110/m.100275 type:complete len:315 (-) Transcript_41110:864-1808(-)